MVLNTRCIYGFCLFIGWRKRFSVVVANVARHTAFMCLRTIHGDSGCECSQIDRMYVCTYNTQGSTSTSVSNHNSLLNNCERGFKGVLLLI